MNEKRKEHRFHANLPIRIMHGTTELLSSTENISRLGTYAEFAREIPVGEDLDVTLVVPPYTKDPAVTGEIRCKGSVFRSTLLRESPSSRSWGSVIVFTAFAETPDKDKLSAFIDFLTLQEEQEIKEGLRRRREKDQLRHQHQENARQEDFQREALKLLRQISEKLERLEHPSARKGKKK
mgnify:CR=1 FL=1